MQRAHTSVTTLCELLRVSRSGYYAWCNRGKSLNSIVRLNNEAAIYRAYTESKSIYGAPKIQRELARLGIQISRATVSRLMKSLGIKSKRTKRKMNQEQVKQQKPIYREKRSQGDSSQRSRIRAG